MDREVRSAGFSAGGVLEYNLAHRRYLAALCMLFKIESHRMHLLSNALPSQYLPTHVTRGPLVAQRHPFAPPLCRTSQYRRTFVPSQYLYGTIFFVTLCLMVWDWRVLRAEIMHSCCHNFILFLSPTIFAFSSFMGWLCGVGVFGLIECSHSFPALHC